MRKIFTFLCVVLTTFFSAQADNATFGWSLSGGGATGADRSADVVTDASGNVFTANSFLNAAVFNGVSLTGSAKGSGASYDNSLFISKISPAKATLWTLYSNVGVVTPTGLATTPNGDLIVTGTIRPVVGGATTNANIIDAAGTVTTFSSLLSSTSINQSFVAKFNSNGIIQWVKEFDSGSAKDKAVTTNALASDASGNVYVTGNFTNTVVLPAGTPVTLTSTNTAQAAFIVKLNGTTGDEVWNKTTTGGIASEILTALTYGDDGYLYAGGIYRNATVPVTVTIGDKSFTPSTGYDLTLIRLDTDGNITYIQNRTNASDTRVKDLTVKNGKVFVGGSFRGDNGGILFSGATALTATAAYLNGFLVTFDALTGSDLWHKGVFAPAIAEINGIVVGKDGNLFAFGYHYNALGTTVASANVVFGDDIVLKDTDPSNKLGDLFLSSYNVSTGVTQEVHLVGKGTGSETANSLAGFGSNLYLLGSYNSAPITFENATTSTATGAFDFFLVDYTVVNPTSGIIPSEISPSPYSYSDHSNRQVVVKNAGSVKIAKIIDASGRSINVTSNSNNDVLNINAQGIASGVYILQLTTSNSQIISQRLIIQ